MNKNIYNKTSLIESIVFHKEFLKELLLTIYFWKRNSNYVVCYSEEKSIRKYRESDIYVY